MGSWSRETVAILLGPERRLHHSIRIRLLRFLETLEAHLPHVHPVAH